jgi:hypothetical protein
LLLSDFRRVEIARQQFLCRVPRGARIRERHDRINPEGKGSLPPTIAIGHPPVSRAIRVDEKMQPAPVAEFLWPLTPFCVADSGVGQWHVGI